VLLVVSAIVLDALAYRRRETVRKTPSTRGIQISLACGVLMGVFYPLVAKAITGDHALGPYTVAFFFAIGTALCSVPVNYFFMRRPLTGGQPVSMADYWTGRAAWHVGNLWWNDLVYRRGPELRGFARARHRSGDFVRDWAGGNDGFRHLGSFYLEGICQCTSEREKASTTDVHVFRRRAGRSRGGSGISEVTALGKN
jgi:hypothetical protein